MSFIAWILLGLIAGHLANRVANRRGQGLIIDMFVGIVGALVGGFLFRLVGEDSVAGLNLWSLLVATTGSILLLIAYHTIRRGGRSNR